MIFTHHMFALTGIRAANSDNSLHREDKLIHYSTNNIGLLNFILLLYPALVRWICISTFYGFHCVTFELIKIRVPQNEAKLVERVQRIDKQVHNSELILGIMQHYKILSH